MSRAAVKIAHAADLHLDSPLAGLSRYEGAPVERIRGATRRALSNLVDLCLDEEVALLLIAGDLYDGDWKDYSTGLFFAAEMSRLRQANVQVVWLRGNHDAQSKITKHLRLPDNVQELPYRRPGTLTFESLGVAVHGQGFETRVVDENLASAYPEPHSGLCNIGLLHTSLTGRAGHDPYAPCSVELLRTKGYDYWALGHVHAREVVSDEPWIVFPGNLQGRHARETGPKGATLLTLAGDKIVSVDPRLLDVVRWAAIDVDVSGTQHPDDVLERLAALLEGELARADERTLCVRLKLVGDTRAHAQLLAHPEEFAANARALATDVGGGEIWIEKVRMETTDRIGLGDVSLQDDALGQIAQSLAQMAADEDTLAALGSELNPLSGALPAELRRQLALEQPATLRALLSDTEQLLLTRLAQGGR
jgi:DNA repair exonuclease SbcCD nuclease subunit